MLIPLCKENDLLVRFVNISIEIYYNQCFGIAFARFRNIYNQLQMNR